MWTVKVVGLGVVTLCLSVELLSWLLRRLRPGKPFNEVLFFPSEFACVEHIFTPSSPHVCLCPLPHGVDTSFSRLLRHIVSASSSLDVCVFAFSNMDLCRALLVLHRMGVTIRVIADRDYAAITGSQIGVLRKAEDVVLLASDGDLHNPWNSLQSGRVDTSKSEAAVGMRICARCNVNSVYMHHKFAVVDGRLLLTGSLNWTLTAVQSNMENILVTEEPDLVGPFIEEFNRLWVHSDPAQYFHTSDQKPAQTITKS